MTTGAPIYLVSACDSGEQFVAAFRRYVDRNGLFIPIAVPIPAGRRGRFAVTLSDGGVMIEGDAEVISSASTPSLLHGRIGMTLRFVDPDSRSKTVLAELEAARLAVKPGAPSVQPRAADVPPTPRPTPPAPSGRVDASTALAECVAIGDLGTLASANAAPKPAQRFVVPSIPPVAAGARPKTASSAPLNPDRPRSPSGVLFEKPKSSTQPVAVVPPPRPLSPSRPLPSAAPIPQLSAKDSSGPTGTLRMPPAPHPAASPSAVVAPTEGSPTPSRQLVPADDTELMQARTKRVPYSDTEMMPALTAGVPHSDTQMMPALTPEGVPHSDTEMMPALPGGVPHTDAEMMSALVPQRRDNATLPLSALPFITPGVPTGRDSDTIKAAAPPAPPAFALGSERRPDAGPSSTPAPVASPAPPIVAAPRPALPEIEIGEPTDLTVIPAPPGDPLDELLGNDDVREGVRRSTESGVGVMPVVSRTAPRTASRDEVDARGDTWEMTAQRPPADLVDPRAATSPPFGPMIPELQEPTGDWTMTPDEVEPTVLPRKSSPAIEMSARAPATGLPSGDWTIARVEDAPDGWSEPSKIEKPRVVQRTGPVVTAVSGEKPLEVTSTARQYEIEEATKSGNNVEVDIALAGVSSSVDVPFTAEMHAGRTATSPLDVSSPAPAPYSLATPLPRTPYGSTHDGSSPGGESTAMIDRSRRRRLLVITASAALAVVLGIIALLSLGSKPDSSASGGSQAPLRLDVVVPVDAAQARVENGSAHSVVPAVAPDAGADPPETPRPITSADACIVELTTVPTGAEVVHGKVVLGTTPAKLSLPCGEPARLTMRKPRFISETRDVKPAKAPTKLRVALVATFLSVKVSSSPPGATITHNGKSLGVTPAIVRLPSYEVAKLVLTREGFASKTATLTPKGPNEAIHTVLEKKRR